MRSDFGIKDVQCSGSESALEDCSYVKAGYCTFWSCVWIECSHTYVLSVGAIVGIVIGSIILVIIIVVLIRHFCRKNEIERINRDK